MFFECVFLVSYLTFVSSKRNKYNYVAKAILQGNRNQALQLVGCSSVHVHVENLSKLGEDPISFLVFVNMFYGYYFILATWLAVSNLEKYAKSF